MARTISIICPTCRARSEKPTGAVNRARKIGAPLYCNLACAGLARRSGKTKEQHVAEKAAYDATYRAKNIERILEQKRRHYRNTYDPAKAAEYRKARMHLHVEYCRRPEYKQKKVEYDKIYNAKRSAGPLWESFIVLRDLEAEISTRASRYEIYSAKGTLNKRKERGRVYNRAHGRKP